MTVKALALVAVVAGCGKSDSNNKPMDPPKLSAAGDVVVPDGHETTYSYNGTAVKLEWTYVSIRYEQRAPALNFFAQDRERPGSFSMSAAIPPGTPSLESMAGTSIGVIPWSISFGNAPEMASGDGGVIQITEVTPTYVAGTFELQACKFAERPCKNVKQVKSGAFKAFRSALSDAAAFKLYTTQPAP